MSHQIKLYVRSESSAPLKFAANFTSYHRAVDAGANLGGYGNFLVETGNHSPSREEQLLLEPKPRRYHNSKRASALLED